MPSEESEVIQVNKQKSTAGSIVSQAGPVAPSHSLIDSRNVIINDGQFHHTHGHHNSLVINISQGSSSQAAPQSSSPPSNESTAHFPGQSSQVEHENSPQVSSQSQEISFQKSNDIYERHLVLKGRGFPLWIPDPNRNLHLGYRRTGIRIGDVGIITHSGAFSFLFNICLPHDDPVNPRILPEHFAPISPPIDATDIENFIVFKNGSHLASASVKKSQTGTAISDTVFESSASEGAILTMPRGARSEDLGNLATFREYAAANVANWYKYVNGPRGREAKNGDVRLVVGFDKTSSWGIATFANQSHQNSCRLKFGPSEGVSASTFTWSENSGIADVRAGPDSEECDELRIDSDPPDVQFENQCLFVRTLNVTLSDDVWADIHSISGSIPVDPRNSQYPRVKNYSGSNRPHSNNPNNGSNLSPSQGAQSGTQRRLQGVDITSDENPPIFVSGPTNVDSITNHPSKVLNDALLARMPSAKMVITHDGDWSSLTQYDLILDPHEFVANVLTSRVICQKNDVVFLESNLNIMMDRNLKGSTSVNLAQGYREDHTGPPFPQRHQFSQVPVESPSSSPQQMGVDGPPGPHLTVKDASLQQQLKHLRLRTPSMVAGNSSGIDDTFSAYSSSSRSVEGGDSMESGMSGMVKLSPNDPQPHIPTLFPPPASFSRTNSDPRIGLVPPSASPPFLPAFENDIMDVMGSDKGSDFLTNFAFVPPSPPQHESVFDYPAFDSAAPTIILPHTSYNGSYYSPYSQHSELSFSGDDIQLQDFPDPMNEYDPLDYDAPNQPSSLLMFTNDSDYMYPHFSPNNSSTHSPFGHSSPFSNASGADDLNSSLGSESNDQLTQQRQRDSSSSGFPRTEENNAVASSSTPNNDTTNLSATSGFIFPNDHSQQQQQRLQTFTFGGTHGASTTSGNEFLSPDSLRSVSDAPKHHRQSRSEDIRSPPMPYAGNSNNIGHGNHQQSLSVGGITSASNFLFPPNVDFHISAAGSASNPNLSLSSSSPGMGHFRRASSGTRSNRGAELWGSLGTQGTLAAPRRMSPYPSPNVSPRVRYTDLELDSDLTAMGLGLGMGDLGEPSVSAGFSDEVALSRKGSYAGLDATITGDGGIQKAESVASVGERSQSRQPVPSGSQTDELPTQVPKVNVTTGRTANASHRRRKQEANFACTVPGCGATFTRGFNLKGHLRSHFEDKPYKCHWHGCGKGFARQHDCKRHEQLHSDFRPFECGGCRKQFARMDALNRHLRSETGVECARIVERGKRSGDVTRGNMESGYDMSAITMTMTGELGMESEEQKQALLKRRQTGVGGGEVEDIWPGVTL